MSDATRDMMVLAIPEGQNDQVADFRRTLHPLLESLHASDLEHMIPLCSEEAARLILDPLYKNLRESLEM